MLPKLREFLSSQNERGAVEIEGRKMAVAYRFTFSGERAWRTAFAASAGTVEKEEETGENGGRPKKGD